MFPIQTSLAFQRLQKAGRVTRIPVEPDVEALALVGPVPLPMRVGRQSSEGRWYVAAPYIRRDGPHHEHISVVLLGDTQSDASVPLVRIHSTCFTGDVLGSLRCDCGPQLDAALEQMSEPGAGGMVLYMAAHEGRGIGLWSKAAAYLLQDEGLDTYEANRALGFEDDARDFRYAAALIQHFLGQRSFRLLTNNPEKVRQLRERGLDGVVRENHIAGVGPWNHRYLSAKRGHGHAIPASALLPCSSGVPLNPSCLSKIALTSDTDAEDVASEERHPGKDGE